ncbi:hypothetical protein CYMTET_49969 [Cymbomonas tetramitiformis]|uniref:SANT domain-containing protein n=1 Tax=Cymbomonas tetramitiformis TaxID=36881 RepID=A0AAE0BP61_9CHLO|nr:hypothetical protein CYMTET_49969 [Cymbomonas tetramitiformis]
MGDGRRTTRSNVALQDAETGEEAESSDEDDRPQSRVGEEYQATNLPQVRELTPDARAAERCLTGALILSPSEGASACSRGETQVAAAPRSRGRPRLVRGASSDIPLSHAQGSARGGKESAAQPAATPVAAMALLPGMEKAIAAEVQRRAATVEQLAAACGEEATAALGVRQMGGAEARDWSAEEERLFGVGFRKHKRSFHRIADLIGTKSSRKVISYYYNAWKTRHTPDSRKYLIELKEEEAAQQAEEEAAAERVAAEVRRKEVAVEERKRERQRAEAEAAPIRRENKETLTWLRASARSGGTHPDLQAGFEVHSARMANLNRPRAVVNFGSRGASKR